MAQDINPTFDAVWWSPCQFTQQPRHAEPTQGVVMVIGGHSYLVSKTPSNTRHWTSETVTQDNHTISELWQRYCPHFKTRQLRLWDEEFNSINFKLWSCQAGLTPSIEKVCSCQHIQDTLLLWRSLPQSSVKYLLWRMSQHGVSLGRHGTGVNGYEQTCCGRPCPSDGLMAATSDAKSFDYHSWSEEFQEPSLG